MIAVDSLLAVFAPIFFGNRLKHHRLTNGTFPKSSDRPRGFPKPGIIDNFC
jgi:hypothetical protein